MTSDSEVKFYIKTAIDHLELLLENMVELKTFIESPKMLQLGLIKCMENAGEAINKLSPEFKESCYEVSWKRLVGARNRTVHEFYKLDPSEVHRYLRFSLGELSKLKRVYMSLDESSETLRKSGSFLSGSS